MKKMIPACLLLLCLLNGCAAAVPEQAAPAVPAVLPVVSSVPAPSGLQPAPVLPDTSAGPSPPMPSTDAAALRLDEIFAATQGFSGSVLIEKGGKVLLCKGYGMANSNKGTANTPETRFLIGSVTKQFTAMAIMQLYSKGLLGIRDTVVKYIPDFKYGGGITLTNMLTQTSGITDFLNDDPTLLLKQPYKALNAENIIELIKAMPLKFQPGSKYSYSNTNYLILGYIVEKVSGLSFGDYLTRNIFGPLGMKNTGVFDPSAPPENMATGHWSSDEPVLYRKPDGTINAETACSVKGSGGAGCLYSTVGDLYLWDQALKTERLLSTKYMNMIFAPAVPVPGNTVPVFYGFGWVLKNHPVYGAIRYHSGALSGFRALNETFTDKGVTVIILFNNEEFNGREAMVSAAEQALLAS